MLHLRRATILLTLHGSRSYGMERPDSDTDVDGVLIVPREYYTSFLLRFEQHQFKEMPFGVEGLPEKCEGTIYDLRKFFALAADCNPNIIEILFTDPDDVLLITPLGERLRALGPRFLSTKAKFTFSGYAVSQLKRIRTHRRWLLSPPKAQPKRADFGLDPDRRDMSREDFGAIEAMIQKAGEAEALKPLPESIVAIYLRERDYAAVQREWGLYQGWQRDRNPKRAELEAKFGYDCKYAAHLVRLMRMCREILTEGVVRVRRPDAEELLAIRDGAWSYEQIENFASAEDTELERIYQAGESLLPRQPNRPLLDDECRSMIEEAAFGIARGHST